MTDSFPTAPGCVYGDDVLNLIASCRSIRRASCQLRSPLTIFKTLAHLALRENDTTTPQELVRSIANTTDSPIILANYLLALARLERGFEAPGMTSISVSGAAIVSHIACLHSATLFLHAGDHGNGLRARVAFRAPSAVLDDHQRTGNDEGTASAKNHQSCHSRAS
ncbi:hypothetical protein [Pseudoduganella sp. UC29_71]|uniref:hypothetical protein n=1 Tax=Pseudoduganella sp. UC29_71 TaxID=3350174 RepID=UPI00366B1EDB